MYISASNIANSKHFEICVPCRAEKLKGECYQESFGILIITLLLEEVETSLESQRRYSRVCKNLYNKFGLKPASLVISHVLYRRTSILSVTRGICPTIVYTDRRCRHVIAGILDVSGEAEIRLHGARSNVIWVNLDGQNFGSSLKTYRVLDPHNQNSSWLKLIAPEAVVNQRYMSAVNRSLMRSNEVYRFMENNMLTHPEKPRLPPSEDEDDLTLLTHGILMLRFLGYDVSPFGYTSLTLNHIIANTSSLEKIVWSLSPTVMVNNERVVELRRGGTIVTFVHKANGFLTACMSNKPPQELKMKFVTRNLTLSIYVRVHAALMYSHCMSDKNNRFMSGLQLICRGYFVPQAEVTRSLPDKTTSERWGHDDKWQRVTRGHDQLSFWLQVNPTMLCGLEVPDDNMHFITDGFNFNPREWRLMMDGVVKRFQPRAMKKFCTFRDNRR